jgi:hypothetical protein
MYTLTVEADPAMCQHGWGFGFRGSASFKMNQNNPTMTSDEFLFVFPKKQTTGLL